MTMTTLVDNIQEHTQFSLVQGFTSRLTNNQQSTDSQSLPKSRHKVDETDSTKVEKVGFQSYKKEHSLDKNYPLSQTIYKNIVDAFLHGRGEAF